MSEEELREQLKIHHAASGEGLRGLADKTGVSFSTLSRFFRGQSIQAKAAKKLTCYLIGDPIPGCVQVSSRKFQVGGKTFLVTISEIL